MKKIIFIALLLAGLFLIWNQKSESNSPEMPIENPKTELKEKPKPSPKIVPPAPPSVSAEISRPAATESPVSPEATWSTQEVFSEIRRLNKVLRNAVAEQIKKREIIFDREDTGAFKYGPIDASVISEVENGIETIRKRAAPDAKANAEMVITGVAGPLADARQHTVIQVMLHPNGTVDVSSWRMPNPPPVRFNQWGFYEVDPSEYPKLGIIEGSQGWGPSPEKKYGEVLPPKIKQTLAEVKKKALGE